MVSSPTIPPGGEGKIKVSLQTSGRKGRLAKTILVYSNDPTQRTFALKLDGTVDVLAVFSPERLNLDRVRRGATVERLVRIEGKLADQVKLSDVRSSKPLTLEGKVGRDDSGRAALTVTVKAGAKEERFSGSLRVKTGLAEPKELTLFVWGVVSPDVYLERSYLFFPAFDARRPPTIQVAIASLSGQRFRVTKIEDPAGQVRGKTVRDKQGGQRLALTLTKLTRSSAPTLSGKLRVHLDRKDQPVIEVRYGVRQAFKVGGQRRVRMPVHRGMIKPPVPR